MVSFIGDNVFLVACLYYLGLSVSEPFTLLLSHRLSCILWLYHCLLIYSAFVVVIILILQYSSLSCLNHLVVVIVLHVSSGLVWWTCMYIILHLCDCRSRGGISDIC